MKNWCQFLTAREKLAPIRHVFHTNISHFVKNAHVGKLYVAYMRIFHIDKTPPNLLQFASDSNYSHAWHDFITGAVLTGYRLDWSQSIMYFFSSSSDILSKIAIFKLYLEKFWAPTLNLTIRDDRILIRGFFNS